eukprot:jgi/Ulvmu1/3475/UM016_0095.1
MEDFAGSPWHLSMSGETVRMMKASGPVREVSRACTARSKLLKDLTDTGATDEASIPVTESCFLLWMHHVEELASNTGELQTRSETDPPLSTQPPECDQAGMTSHGLNQPETSSSLSEGQQPSALSLCHLMMVRLCCSVPWFQASNLFCLTPQLTMLNAS